MHLADRAAGRADKGGRDETGRKVRSQVTQAHSISQAS
jgi:hypothetical protein